MNESYAEHNGHELVGNNIDCGDQRFVYGYVTDPAPLESSFVFRWASGLMNHSYYDVIVRHDS